MHRRTMAGVAALAAALQALGPAHAAPPANGAAGTRIDPGILFDPTPVGGAARPAGRPAGDGTQSPAAPVPTPAARDAPPPPGPAPAAAAPATPSPPPATRPAAVPDAPASTVAPRAAARKPARAHPRPGRRAPQERTTPMRAERAPERPITVRRRGPARAPFKVPGSLLPTQ